MKKADEQIETSASAPYSAYAPYEAFWEGFVDYRHGLQRNPYEAKAAEDVQAHAWDRGREASMRVSRSVERV